MLIFSDSESRSIVHKNVSSRPVIEVTLVTPDAEIIIP